MQKFLIVLIFLLLNIFCFKTCYGATTWYYPLEKSQERVLVKDYGILVDQKFYIGKETLFPYNRFFGYHAGVDLETFPEEQKILVPFYAIYSGRITFADSVNGYGGVVLERLDDNKHVALYGHVQLVNLAVQLNEEVLGGQLIGYVAEAFSKDSGMERKHLHFALHKGINNYFLGHENSISSLNKNWENPMNFLLSNNAIDRSDEELNQKYVYQDSTEKNLLQKIINFFKEILLF